MYTDPGLIGWLVKTTRPCGCVVLCSATRACLWLLWDRPCVCQATVGCSNCSPRLDCSRCLSVGVRCCCPLSTGVVLVRVCEPWSCFALCVVSIGFVTLYSLRRLIFSHIHTERFWTQLVLLYSLSARQATL